jgi:dUTPase
MQQHEIQIPAVQLPLTGFRSSRCVLTHNSKQQRFPFDAGLDLVPSHIIGVADLKFAYVIDVGTSLVAHLAPGFKGEILGRSSSPMKLHGAEVIHGLIDAGYQGELIIRVRVLFSDAWLAAVKQDIQQCIDEDVALAQFMISQCLVVVPFEPALPPTQTPRGSNGFGSTDKKP